MANQCSICMYMAHTQILLHSWGLEQGIKGAVSRNSAKLGNYKMPVKLRGT